MRYVRLSKNSGLKVSIISLGTWHLPRLPERDEAGAYRIDVDEFRRVLKLAHDEGVIFLDTANRYHGGISPVPLTHVGNAEKLLGELLKGYERESWVIATKVAGRMRPGPNGEGLSRKHVMWQISESLRRLRTDYVDLYYMHRHDPETPKLEIMRTFTYLVRQGLVRYIGASNVPAIDLVEFVELAERYMLEPITALQYKYNLIERKIEADIIPVAKRFGMGLVVYSPLAQGVLTGKYVDREGRKWRIPPLSRATYMKWIADRYFTDSMLEFMLKFIEFAEEKDLTPAQLALAWTINMKKVWEMPIIPIISVSRLSHLEEAIAASEVELNRSDLDYLDEISGKARLG
ncbi:MAG TPA: aldo/keto reductase [Candidatus Korarchaeota archaeon]|nr:aldo/keto reductase [Candidatus Korarchaeota archaeon]